MQILEGKKKKKNKEFFFFFYHTIYRKREIVDKDPRETAKREFLEESGELFTEMLKEKKFWKKNLSKDVIWNAAGKYLYFILKVKPFSIDKEKDSESPEHIWVSLPDLASSTDFFCIPGAFDLDQFFDDNSSFTKVNIYRFFQGSLCVRDVRYLFANNTTKQNNTKKKNKKKKK